MANLIGLPRAGATCSYNGVSFLTLYKSSVSSRPILDEAKRTTIYVEHTLSVEGYIATVTTDSSLTTMRKLLTACGGALTYTSKGFGDLTVNVNVVRDVAWGPIPEILEWVPLGGDGNAAKVTWRVTTRIPECDFAKYQFAFVALNYELALDIDESGYTTDRMGGYLEIPMTRITQGNRTLPNNVDFYRPLIRPDVALGFQRKSQSFHVSKDKRRLDFQFVDEEIPVPFPDGVTKIDARETIEGSLDRLGRFIAGAFRGWLVTIEATITLARGLPKTDALAKFFVVVSSRTKHLTDAPPPNGGTKAVLLPLRVRYEDDIFDRTSRFSITFACVAGLTAYGVLSLSGIWKPIEGTGYAKWLTSLGPTNTTGARGWAGAENHAGADAIIDLCIGATSAPYLKQPLGPLNAAPKLGAPADPGSILNAKLKNLDPGSSWVTYRPGLHSHSSANVVRHKPLPRPPGSGGGGGTLTATKSAPVSGGSTVSLPTNVPGSYVGPAITDAGAASALGGLNTGDQGRDYPADVFQRTAAPTRTVDLVGWAVRIGYRIPVPKLDSVGGVPCVEMERHVFETEPWAFGPVLIFFTSWAIRYAVGSAPAGQLPYPANPEFDTPAGTGKNSPLQ